LLFCSLFSPFLEVLLKINCYTVLMVIDVISPWVDYCRDQGLMDCLFC